MKLDERTNELHCHLNGQYWGVYEYREKVDDTDFTEEYRPDPYFVDFLKTGGTGKSTERATIGTTSSPSTTQDMTVDANYEYAVSQLHLSLIDYFILNSYIVSAVVELEHGLVAWSPSNRYQTLALRLVGHGRGLGIQLLRGSSKGPLRIHATQKAWAIWADRDTFRCSMRLRTDVLEHQPLGRLGEHGFTCTNMPPCSTAWCR